MNFYFKWLNKTRSNPDVIQTRMKHGWLGYGLYAAVMEVLNEHNGRCNKAIIEFELNLKDHEWEIISECEAFIIKGEIISHPYLVELCAERRQVRKERSKAGKKGMKARWNSQQDLFEEKSQSVESHNGSAVTNVITKDNNIIDIDRVRVIDRSKSLSQSDKSLNQVRKFVEDSYYEWMEERKTPAKFSVANRKAAKEIAAYLFGVIHKAVGMENPEQVEARSKIGWKFILDNFGRWGKYESSKLRLIDINSNITNIINNIKNGTGDTKSRSTGGSKTSTTISSIDSIANF